MKNKELGIWMDHASAHFIDFRKEVKRHSIESEFSHEDKVKALFSSESMMHNKEQLLNEKFYKDIGEEIVKYDHVLLFGPTNAKTELHNYLTKDVNFKDIILDVKSADKMSENEQNAFVKSHFEMS